MTNTTPRQPQIGDIVLYGASTDIERKKPLFVAHRNIPAGDEVQVEVSFSNLLSLASGRPLEHVGGAPLSFDKNDRVFVVEIYPGKYAVDEDVGTLMTHQEAHEHVERKYQSGEKNCGIVRDARRLGLVPMHSGSAKT